MQTSNYFNPEDAAKAIMTKSFLKSRQTMRESGSKFFVDNKIRSCSYVKSSKDGHMKAVPFYDKRNQTMYPTRSEFGKSWSSNTYSNKKNLNAGMGSKKPLIAYNPKDPRNLIGIPDFIPPYPNSSHIEIGKRKQRDAKHYVTNYGNSNSFIYETARLPTNHPGIQAFRNKWMKSRLDR